MRPLDIDRFRILSGPRLHPTQDLTVFSVSRANLEKDRYDSSLWIADSGNVRELAGVSRVSGPEWSRDGSKLGLLMKVPDDPEAVEDDAERHPQLAILDDPRGGGAPRVLTKFPLGVSKFKWSPDGRTILVAAAEYAEPWANLSVKDRGKQPRRITQVPWRFDASSTWDDRRTVVALVDVTGQREPRRIDIGNFVDIGDIAWHPDGSRFVVLAERAHADRTRLEQVILDVDAASGDVKSRHLDGSWTEVHFAGPRLIAIGLPRVYDWPAPYALYEIGADGTPLPLVPDLDRMVSRGRAAGGALHFLYEDLGRSCLARWSQEGLTKLEDTPLFITDFDARDDGDRVLIAQAPADPGELVRVRGGKAETVTGLNRDFRDSVSLVPPEHFVVQTGGADVDAWLYLPKGTGKAPVLLNIHGGPATQYGFGFFDEFQVYAAAGYAVVACNPRGSSGRGKDHLRGVRSDAWGVADQEDVLACLDAALQRSDRLDAGRIGVMGGSYGGFLTAWLIARTDRFKSAVVERALLDWETFSGNSDIATIFAPMYFDDASPEFLATKSPQRFAGSVKTPTLIVHSEQDWRCPIDQAERYFHALLRNGVTTEFLRFPGECHELSRAGNPKHREARFQAIVEWHDRFLK